MSRVLTSSGSAPREAELDNQGQAGLLVPVFPNAATAGVTLITSTSYFARFVPSRDFSFTTVKFCVTAAAGSNDNVDVGLYSAAGAKTISSGATAGKLNAGTGWKSVSFSGSVTAGTVYYWGFAMGAIGSTAATVLGAQMSGDPLSADAFGATVGTRLSGYLSASATLPSTITFTGGYNNAIIVALT